MAVVQPVNISGQGRHRFSDEVLHVVDLGVQLLHGQERCKVRSVCVRDDQHQERIRSCHDTGWQRRNFEHVNRERLGYAMP